VTNPAALRLEQPLEIDDARRASRRLAELRREAEDSHETMTKEAAEAERVYRKKYAQEFIRGSVRRRRRPGALTRRTCGT
jgi:hypothetical protein